MERCPIVDTWWQTETGSIVISPLPGTTATKPGSATQPLPGYSPKLLSETASRSHSGTGLLVLDQPWPSMLRTLYRDDERFVETYFGASIARRIWWETPPGSTRTAITGSSAGSTT